MAKKNTNVAVEGSVEGAVKTRKVVSQVEFITAWMAAHKSGQGRKAVASALGLEEASVIAREKSYRTGVAGKRDPINLPVLNGPGRGRSVDAAAANALIAQLMGDSEKKDETVAG